MPLVLVPPYKKKFLAEVIASGNDPYFANVVLQMHMNGSNGSTSLTDVAGGTAYALGSAALTTSNKKFGSASLSTLSSSGVAIESPTGSSNSRLYEPGTLDFTLEAWIYRTSSTGGVIAGTYRHRIGFRGGFRFEATNTGALQLILDSATALTSTAGVLPLNTWLHVAVCRVGTDYRMLVNGVTVGTFTNATNIVAIDYATSQGSGAVDHAGDFHIGYFPADAAIASPFTGLIDDVRYTKGVARYTQDFVVATEELSDGGYDQYISNVSLLMHGTEPLRDSKSAKPFTIGNVGVSTSIARFSASAEFNGTSSYIYTDPDASLVMGTGDFVHEAWIYVKARPTIQATVWTNAPSSGTQFQHLTIGLNIMNSGIVRVQSTYVVFLTGTTVIPLNTWTHVAYGRVAGVLRLFINGVQEASGSFGNDLSSQTQFFIGADRTASGQGQNFNGNIAEMRVTKGAGRYSKNFYPGRLPYFDA